MISQDQAQITEKKVPKVIPPDEGLEQLGSQEAQAFAAGNLEKYNENDLKRDSDFKDHVNRGMIFIFWILTALTAIGIGTLAWHYLLPEDCAYLSTAQIETIKNLLTGGIVANVMASIFEKKIK